jgi:hypothetical protein
MLIDQIRSLAKTHNPIILENLPPEQIYILHDAFVQIERYYRTNQDIPYPPTDPQPYEIPHDIEDRLQESLRILPTELFKTCVFAFLKNLHHFKPAQENLLDGLAEALRPIKYLDRFPNHSKQTDNPGINQKTNHHVNPKQVITGQPISNPSPIAAEIPVLIHYTHLPTIAQVKHYALVRKATVFDYMSEQAPSLSYPKVHKFIQHHGNFKLCAPGKVVYDGGFYWIARELKISIRTVWRVFHWMAQRKLVTKIAPQNLKKHKRSRWYVCTSMAQNLKLWRLATQGEKP